MKFGIIDGKPVPLKLVPELDAMGFGHDITLNSCDRSPEGVAFARSKGFSLSSQVELWNGWNLRLPGFNPANRPGQSTHERRNDGVAFPGPVGMPLRYWQVGIDGDNTPLALERARARGFTATLTYPGSTRERQHMNFRRQPRIKVFRPLKRGARGPRVGNFTRQLAYLKYLPKATGHFGAAAEKALMAYQRDHHLQTDGVYGVHTSRQLAATFRHKRQCRREAKKIKNRAERERALHRCDERFGPPARGERRGN